MKKYLLLLFAMLISSLGGWADSNGEFGSYKSTWEIDGTTLTLTINEDDDLKGLSAKPDACDVSSVVTIKVVTGSGVSLIPNTSETSGYGSSVDKIDLFKGAAFQVLDLSEAKITLVEATSGKFVLPIAVEYNNIIVPAGANPLTYRYGSKWWIPSEIYKNSYSVNDKIVTASLNNISDTPPYNLTSLSNISSDATTLRIVNEVGAVNLSGVLSSGQILDLTKVTTGSNGSNAINVAAGVKVYCLSNDVKNRISGTNDENIEVVNPNIECTAGELETALTTLAAKGMTPTSIKITSSETALTSDQMAYFEQLEGLEYLSLEADDGTNISSLKLPPTLEGLALPKSDSPESSVTPAMKNVSSLKYIYAPYSGTQDKDQMVADYVWVNQPGGLWQAMENESRLNSAVYVKIACNVAGGVQLNEDDAKFGNHSISASSENDYPWQYIDLSGTFFGVAATNASTAPHDKGYRIILPDNLTGDHMAIFASKPEVDANDNPDRGYRGKVAAVYSYSGTTLNLMEITDASYHTNALSDSRIVHDGITAVKVVSGSYNGTVYSVFDTNLLTALNNAKSTITSATISVGTGLVVTNLAFTNANLTTLTLDNINNSSAVLNVGQCSNLTTLNVQNATLSSISATSSETKATKLANVDLDYTTTSGDIDLSGCTALTSLSADHTNLATTGILKVGSTAVTSLNLSTVSAKSIDVQNATSLANLNINGITLASKDKSATPTSGTVNVTREGSDYSNLTITAAEDFDGDRIIPENPDTKKYTLTKLATPHAEITAAGSSLETSNVSVALSTYNTNKGTSYTVDQIEVLHVTGTLTDADISYIGSNMPSLAVLDLSGVTTYSGSGLATGLSAAIPKTTAIILPGEDKAAMYALQTANYQCLGYITAENKLSIYGYNEAVGNLALATESPIVTSSTALSFLYSFSDASGSFNGYPSATASMLTGLSKLPAKSIDMTWLNISDLGKNFTSLDNENTHYLIIPQSSNSATTTSYGVIYHNDFSDVTASDATNVYYSYSTNIWLVASYKSPVSPYASAAYFGGRAFDFGPYGQNTTALLAYVTTGGAAHVNSDAFNYLESLVPAYTRFVGAGTFDATAVSGLAAVDATEVDLVSATITDANLANYSNSNVVYMALPDGSNSAINATSADNFAFSSCTNLKAVGAYNPTKNLYTVHSTSKTVTSEDPLTQENSIYKITQLVAPNPSRTAGSTYGLGHLQASGYLTRTDICTNGSEAQAGLANMTTIASFTTADLSKAVFLNQSDMTFFHLYTDAIPGANWGNTPRHIDLPTDERMTEIPRECFVGANDRIEDGFGTSTTNADGETVEGLCIPANYKYIRQNALYGLNGVTHLTTTPSNGVEPSACDNGAGTLTLSASLLEIETGAFSFNDNGNRAIQHVYVLAKDAPKCASRAFPSLMTYGNNGYTNTRPYQFANYADRMAILHFPNQLTLAQKKKYVDVTREYTLKDETGETDGDGNLLRWPTQSEFSRSYGQGQLGYVWDNWTGTRVWFDDEHTVGGEINNEGYSVDGSSFIVSYTGGLKDGITRNNSSAEVKTNGDQNEFGDYLGWHEFCLGYSGYFYDVETQDEAEYYELDWYTVCIPYNLTPEMVAKAVGVKYDNSISKTLHRLDNTTVSVSSDIYPELRTFIGINRKPSTGEILLHISANLSDNTDGLKDVAINEKHGSLTDAGSNLIKGGYPYLIKPIVPKSIYDELATKFTGAGKYILSKIVDKSGLNGYYKAFIHEATTTNVLVPFENHQIVAISTDNGNDLTEIVGGETRDYLYNFVGTYTDRSMPQYCYYMGVSKSGVHKFYRSTTTSKTWNAYSAIIAPLGVATYTEDRRGENPTVVMSYSGVIDDTEGVAHSRVMFLFDNMGIEDLENDETTAIETIDGVRVAPIKGKIYNLRGQYVGNSIDLVPKGVYIVNGKKLIVR